MICSLKSGFCPKCHQNIFSTWALFLQQDLEAPQNMHISLSKIEQKDAMIRQGVENTLCLSNRDIYTVFENYVSREMIVTLYHTVAYLYEIRNVRAR